MGLLRWMAGLASRRGRAMALYRSGMAKARKRDYRGAIADYTAAIDSPNVPIDVKGMATYNRALAYAAIDANQKAADDLAAMLEMPGLPGNVITEARQRRERIRRRLQKEE
jgi:tetratricopeptide (TPR) repeat protein